MEVGDAIGVIVRRLRTSPERYPRYGYDIWLPSIWEDYVRERDGLPATEYNQAAARGIALSAVFYAAAWELCRRGLLRPGVRAVNTQVVPGSDGYSFTPMGRKWLADVDDLQFAPIEHGRVAQILSRFDSRFGPGYVQRAQEAVRCYFATAYLGCCAMSGAAAESILLAWTVAKTGDEAAVLRAYASAGGRGRVEKMLLGQASAQIADRVRSFTDLLKYWRDASAHGAETTIAEIEAYDALGRLLRFAHLADERWIDLAGPRNRASQDLAEG